MDKGNVLTHGKLATGAAVMPEFSKYPHAAATIDPTSRPTITAQLFMIGGPKRSHTMIVTNTRKPSPINSGLPQGRACGALALGHMGLVAVEEAGVQPEPPPQSCMPDLMSETPMRRTVGPVTRGGKTRERMRLLMNERPISRSAQRQDVPRRAPYPAGQGSWLPLASMGQYPDLYIWENAPIATVMVAKEVPTTDNRPVPR